MMFTERWLPPVGEVLQGRYHLVEFIGKGPTGAVFKGIDLALKRGVAVKVLHPGFFEGDRRTINAFRVQRARAFQHPNIVAYHDIVVPEDGSPPFITEDLIEGLSLRTVQMLRTDAEEPLTHAEVRYVIEGVASALRWVHQLGVHGNLKPENIFLAGELVKVTDPYFLVGRAQVRWSTGVDPLSDHYLAPEQLLRAQEETRQSDLFALGLLTGELTAGATVRPGLPLAAQAADIPGALDELFLKSTSTDPVSRYASVDSFLADLRRAFPMEGQRVVADLGDTTEVPLADVLSADEIDAIEEVKRARQAERGEPWQPPVVPADVQGPATEVVVLADDAEDLPWHRDDDVQAAAARTSSVDEVPVPGGVADEVTLEWDEELETSAPQAWLAKDGGPKVADESLFDRTMVDTPEDRQLRLEVLAHVREAAQGLTLERAGAASAPAQPEEPGAGSAAAGELVDGEADAEVLEVVAAPAAPADEAEELEELEVAAGAPEPTGVDFDLAGVDLTAPGVDLDEDVEAEPTLPEAALPALPDDEEPLSETSMIEVEVEAGEVGDEEVSDDDVVVVVASGASGEEADDDVIDIDGDSDLVVDGDLELDEEGVAEVELEADDERPMEVGSDRTIPGLPLEAIGALPMTRESEGPRRRATDETPAVSRTAAVPRPGADDGERGEAAHATVIPLPPEDSTIVLERPKLHGATTKAQRAEEAEQEEGILLASDEEEPILLEGDEAPAERTPVERPPFTEDATIDVGMADVMLVAVRPHPKQASIEAASSAATHTGVPGSDRPIATRAEPKQKGGAGAKWALAAGIVLVLGAAIFTAVQYGGGKGGAKEPAKPEGGGAPQAVAVAGVQADAGSTQAAAPDAGAAAAAPDTGAAVAQPVEPDAGQVAAADTRGDTSTAAAAQDTAVASADAAPQQVAAADTAGSAGSAGGAEAAEAAREAEEAASKKAAEEAAAKAAAEAEAAAKKAEEEAAAKAAAEAEAAKKAEVEAAEAAKKAEEAAAAKKAAEEAAAKKAEEAAAKKAAEEAAKKELTPEQIAANEAKAKAQAEERKAKEAERLARKEEDRLAKEEARKAKEEARLAKLEAARLAKEEAKRKKEEAKAAKEAAVVAAATPDEAGGDLDLKCPAGMRKISTKVTREIAGHKVIEKGAFCIEPYEFPGAGQKPRVNVDWFGASRACEGRGRRLCTSSEWKKACGGKYPYGKTYDSKACNTMGENGEERDVKPSGSMKSCKSPYGIYDMSGNVSEWTADKTVNGGNSVNDDESATCGRSPKRMESSPASYVGFRCCADPE